MSQDDTAAELKALVAKLTQNLPPETAQTPPEGTTWQERKRDSFDVADLYGDA